MIMWTLCLGLDFKAAVHGAPPSDHLIIAVKLVSVLFHYFCADGELQKMDDFCNSRSGQCFSMVVIVKGDRVNRRWRIAGSQENVVNQITNLNTDFNIKSQ